MQLQLPVSTEESSKNHCAHPGGNKAGVHRVADDQADDGGFAVTEVKDTGREATAFTDNSFGQVPRTKLLELNYQHTPPPR